MDSKYELIKENFRLSHSNTLIDTAQGLCYNHLIRTWCVDTSELSQNQKALNEKLLSILSAPVSDDDENIEELEKFLKSNQSNPDLKKVLDLNRGESGLTILHALASMAKQERGMGEHEVAMCLLLEAGADPNVQNNRGETPLHYAIGWNEAVQELLERKANPNIQDIEGKAPLHYAASIGSAGSIDVLLEHKADPNIRDIQEKTPLQVAIDNHNYFVEECFLTDNQKKLQEELHSIIGIGELAIFAPSNTRLTKLKDFLNKYKNTQDLKKVLNLRDRGGKSQILQYIRSVVRGFETSSEEAERLLLEAGAIYYKELDRKESLLKSGTLWDSLILNQQKKLKFFLHEVDKAQDMNRLAQVVNGAIEFGVRLNFPIHLDKMVHQNTYNFTDYVIKKISELKKRSKVVSDIEVASGIVCQLVSKGAALYNVNNIYVIDELEEFEGHKANMKEAYADHMDRTLEFVEIVKSASTGELKDAKLDNSTLYLEYSGDSIIDVAKITDGARDLGLTNGEIRCEREVIKFAKNEVEVIEERGVRNYTDLADGSDVVLIFYTTQGELKVGLYPDKKDKNLIRVKVEVGYQEKWERLKNCKEEIGENCRLGGLSVNEAIGEGSFVRSGKLMRSEVISPSKKISEEVKAAVEGLKPGDIVNSSLDNTSLSYHIQKSTQQDVRGV